MISKFSQLYIAAAKVGGDNLNNNLPDYLLDNLLIATNLISAAFESKIRNRISFLGSQIYPKMAKQPIKEEYLLNGFLEPTNEPYAKLAKILCIKIM